MEFYIQGSPKRTKEIEMAFKNLGYDTIKYFFNAESNLYFTFEGEIRATNNELFKTFIKSRSDYKELPLPVKSNSKFKPGTWLWHKEKGDFPVLIAGYDEKKGYLAKYNIGLETYFGRDIIENYYRLWEISDARNGDVLVVNGSSKEYKWIGIFKALTSDTSFSSHCHYNCGMCEFVTDIARCTKHGIKYNDIRPATNEERVILFAKMREAGYEWDEKKKELHKIIEPNFKVGDWVVTDYGKVSQVVSVDKDGDGYTLDDGVYFSGSWCDMYHRWTIQDVKDGDVLVKSWSEDGDSWEKIIIFKNYHAKGVKGLIKQPCVEGYGNTFKNGKLAFREEVPYYSRTWTDNLQPATKEQRNLLFQKMKENGCEWDAEKKELRKIKPHYDIANFYAGMPVLVRDYNDEEWCYVQFSHIRKLVHALVFNAGCNDWYQCIPFEGNEALLGTTDMPSEEFINW